MENNAFELFKEELENEEVNILIKLINYLIDTIKSECST